MGSVPSRQLKLENINGLDDAFHSKVRLGVMTILVSGPTDFTALKNRLQLTGGNLGAHLRVLEDAGYLDIEKKFVGRRPKTTYRITPLGRRAFRVYLKDLESVIRLAGS